MRRISINQLIQLINKVINHKSVFEKQLDYTVIMENKFYENKN